MPRGTRATAGDAPRWRTPEDPITERAAIPDASAQVSHVGKNDDVVGWNPMPLLPDF